MLVADEYFRADHDLLRVRYAIEVTYYCGWICLEKGRVLDPDPELQKLQIQG